MNKSITFTGERVLSIQAHVVFGYVGSKSAVFPLQCLGYDVDVVHTVHVSNHYGYGQSGGSNLTPEEFNTMMQIMEQNELLTPGRLLTGFIPGAAMLSAVEKTAAKLKRQLPGLVYLLDPVMGDAGQLYVAPDVIPIYRAMLPLATIITPNWFEVETLTDVKLVDIPSLQRALEILHKQYHVPHVVISSIPLQPWLLDALPKAIKPSEPTSPHLLCITSSYPPYRTAPLVNGHNINDERSVVHAQCVPLVPCFFLGVGDLFSALLLAHFHADQEPEELFATPLSAAVSQALTKTHAIVKMTQAQRDSLPEEERLPTDDEMDAKEPVRRKRRMRGRELAIIRGQDIIRGVGSTRIRDMIHWQNFWEL